MQELNLEWQVLLSSFGVKEGQAEATFTGIAAAYCEPGRYYHTLEHIGQVLTTIDNMPGPLQNPAAVKFAAWFHDVIYDSRAKDNEERSAQYAEDVLRSLAIPADIIEATCRLILCTKSHQAERGDSDAQILLDADLSILGTEPNRYQQYAQAIRQEYGWVPDLEYRAGRKQVLQKFLQRARLFFTPAMFEKAEPQARRNLQAEIEALDAF